ncbi:MAG: MBL fold metallo-hydrolase [Trueperaceae bacterium]|nr:MBL fold metallo-hydrolase [Trueperaceae bacterium]
MSSEDAPTTRPLPDVERVAPGAWRLEAAVATLPPFDTVNTYVIAHSGVAVVVDPGGERSEAADATRRTIALAGATLKAIVLTHTHADHLAGVDRLLEGERDVAVYAHPRELQRLDPAWRATGLAHGRRLTVGDEVVETVHTPGHSPGHIALWLSTQRLLLAGDLVAGAGSVWIGLPEGDVGEYLESLARAAALEPAVIAPGHGPVRHDGALVLHEARAHRLARERGVLAALRIGPLDLSAIRRALYPDLDAAIVDHAERSVLAHLRKLMRERRVMHVGTDERGPFDLAPGGGRD